MAHLILIRHGQSEWNAKGLWTGLTDIPLNEKGITEANEAADAIKNIPVDIAYTSELKRAIETLDSIKQKLALNNLMIYENQALNERDYGDLTGKNKWKIKEEYGEEQFHNIRRGWNVPIPNGETLKDVFNRVIPYYNGIILPSLVSGKNVLIVAHSNSLRALVKYLDNINDKDIEKLEIATGEIYVYDLDSNGKIISKKILNARPNNV